MTEVPTGMSPDKPLTAGQARVERGKLYTRYMAQIKEAEGITVDGKPSGLSLPTQITSSML